MLTSLFASHLAGGLGTILLVFAVVAFAVALWRAILRDALGALIALVVGIVLLFLA